MTKLDQVFIAANNVVSFERVKPTVDFNNTVEVRLNGTLVIYKGQVVICSTEGRETSTLRDTIGEHSDTKFNRG